MKTHKLKILPPYFQDVCSGRKKFEVRKNDRCFKVGDLLNLREFAYTEYTGKSILVRVEYILSNFEGLQPDYIVMGISRIKMIDEF